MEELGREQSKRIEESKRREERSWIGEEKDSEEKKRGMRGREER